MDSILQSLKGIEIPPVTVKIETQSIINLCIGLGVLGVALMICYVVVVKKA